MEIAKTTKKVERTILDSDSVERVKMWIKQIEKELGDSVDVTQKSLVNFVIQSHSDSLSADEIQKIKAQNFDLIKALKKATDEAMKAKQAGHELQLNEIINLIQTPSVNSDLRPKRTYKKRQKTQDSNSSDSAEITPNTRKLEGL